VTELAEPEFELDTKEPMLWRNWYRVLRTAKFINMDNTVTRVFEKGAVIKGKTLYPSKVEAESSERNCQQSGDSAVAQGFALYLGAYPVGERPAV